MAGEVQKTARKNGLELVIVPQSYEAPPKDLFMTLPGELRNRIYGLVVLNGSRTRPWSKPGDVIGIPSRGYPGVLHEPEPALLRVSKIIRSEAGYIYYGSYRFRIRSVNQDLEDACTWVYDKFQNCGVGFNLNAKLHIAPWRHVSTWLHLGKLFYRTDLGDGDSNNHVEYWLKMITTPPAQLWCWEEGTRYRQMYTTVRQDLRELIELSVEARKRKVGYDFFEVLLEGWAATVIEKPKMVSGPQKRDAAAASLRDMCMGPRKKRTFSFHME